MGHFKGFGPKALAFFTALKFHQDRAWFEENKSLYQSDVLDPMVALIEDLASAFAKGRIPLKGDGKRSIFRIHRDVRFARDKSPYKTHAGAIMTRSGEKMDPGCLYIHIAPEGCFAAAGFHMPEADALARMRKAIRAHPAKFKALIAALKKGGLAFSDYDQLTRVPRGFEEFKGGPLEGAIRLKSLIVEESLAAKLIATPKLADALVDFTVRAKPLLTFGWQALE